MALINNKYVADILNPEFFDSDNIYDNEYNKKKIKNFQNYFDFSLSNFEIYLDNNSLNIIKWLVILFLIIYLPLIFNSS